MSKSKKKCRKPRRRKRSKKSRDDRSKAPDREIVTVTNVRQCVRRYEACQHKFLNYTEIQEYLHKLQNDHKERVELHEIGQSTERRPILMALIHSASENPKTFTLVESGSNGKDFMAISSALVMIDSITKNVNATKITDYLIIPCSNPDAYEQYLTNGKHNPKVSLNLSYNTTIVLGMEDLDPIPNETYMCAVQQWKNNFHFRAPETEALKNVITKYRVAIRLCISLQEEGQKIAYPCGCISGNLPDVDDLCKVAKSGQMAIHCRCFEIGSIYGICGLSFGSLPDYVRLHQGIKFCYVIHMNDRDKRPDVRNILRYGIDMVKCIKNMARNVYMYYNRFEANKQCVE